MNDTPLTYQIGQMLDAWKRGATDRQLDDYEAVIVKALPHGSGFDAKPRIIWDLMSPEDQTRVVFGVPFHHMNENGYYCGWSETKVFVSAGFAGIELNADADMSGVELHGDECVDEDGERIDIKSRDEWDKKQHEDYVEETYHTALTNVSEWSGTTKDAVHKYRNGLA